VPGRASSNRAVSRSPRRAAQRGRQAAPTRNLRRPAASPVVQRALSTAGAAAAVLVP
jgi:hypothetical protein